MHLLIHAKTYGTLTNTQVGIKEMVHRIFKGMVPNTNHKNIELDLLKHYTTLFAIRHITDGGADSRFTRFCAGFANMPSNFNELFSNWYISENKLLQDEEDHGDVNGKIKIYIFYILIKINLFFNIIFIDFFKISYITSGFHFQYFFKMKNV